MGEEFVNWKDLFNGEYEKKHHPFQYFVNYKLFKEKHIFGYAPYHVIFESFEFCKNRIEDFLYEVKWAYQRVYRGWDDRVIWSVDQWLDEMMPDILNNLKLDKHGTPNSIFTKDEMDENGNVSEENHKKAHERWNKELDKMIAGFVASRKLRDLDYNWRDKIEEQAVKKVFDEGMQSFVKYYHSLWD